MSRIVSGPRLAGPRNKDGRAFSLAGELATVPSVEVRPGWCQNRPAVTVLPL